MRLRWIMTLAFVIGLGWLAWPYLGRDLFSIGQETAETPAKPQPLNFDLGSEPGSGAGVAKLDLLDDHLPIEDGGANYIDQYTGTPNDPASLEELRKAIDDRVNNGLSLLGGELDQLKIGPNSTKEELVVGRDLYHQFGMLAIYAGRLDDATSSFQRALELAGFMDASNKETVELHDLLGIVALRRGEVDNELGRTKPAGLRYPISKAGAASRKDGYREAVRQFQMALTDEPRDLRVRWLLNMAYQKLGDYPSKVPPEYLVPEIRPKVEASPSTIRLADVSSEAGLWKGGPNLGGAPLFDDFDGDDFPDLFLAGLDTNFGTVYYHNRGDGGFDDWTETVGLPDQVYVRSAAAADFDNDGKLDVVLLRGGGERPYRPTLLKNQGDGAFLDVTRQAGLIEPIASDAACWGDYDSDGYVDLFIAGEYFPERLDVAETSRPDPRNRSRLFHNRKDGTFEEVASQAGIENLECAKGGVWGDVDNDGDLDLFIVNRNASSRLYRNDGLGRFAKVDDPLNPDGFGEGSSCWFWDVDNDGRVDLFVNDPGSSVPMMVSEALGLPADATHRPRLYRNLGPEGFSEIGEASGLDAVKLPLGGCPADLDGDGLLDVFISSGFSSIESFVPSVLLRNIDGKRFDDITKMANAAFLSKSLFVSTADYDLDGDLDLFLHCGGNVPGDSAYNLLLRNDSPRRSNLQVRLRGVSTNRFALGARLKATFKTLDGAVHTIYRTVGEHPSRGYRSLSETLGLADAKQVDKLEVSWPVSKSTQVFKELKAGQAIEITEGNPAFKVLTRGAKPQPKAP